MRIRVVLPIYLLVALANAQAQVDPGARITETVLREFGTPPKGGNPYSGVVRDSSGNLYGTATVGGAANFGVVYKVNKRGVQTVLHSFAWGDGANPYAGVTLDSAGNLYGTTYAGGSTGYGVVFKLDPSGNETVLHTFTGGADGYLPFAGVTLDSAGNLYGTTYLGGSGGYGAVYKLDSGGNETVLHNFIVSDGSFPYAGVVRDSGGNLYGTTSNGGSAGYGVVYKLDPSGNETVLHNFTGGLDGGLTTAGVVLDSAGNLYGTASTGGSAGHGVVYKLDPSGSETVLYNFTGGSDGGNPDSGVIRDSAGNLYGTTYSGGSGGYGAVYNSAGNETVLHAFAGGSDGENPYAGVILDSSGNLYGTSYGGGTGGAGVVYELPAGRSETVLYAFPGAAGNAPFGGVVFDSAGNLYGTTLQGGSSGAGLVYRLDTRGNETVLHNFTNGPDGGFPEAGVVFDAAGNLCGTTEAGGSLGLGTVYRLDPSGNETVLHSFTGGADGYYPSAGVILDSAGNLYGTSALGGSAAYGVVCKIDPGGNETVLYSFTGGSDGGYPRAGVLLDTAGNLYGTTASGGSAVGFAGYGVVYKLDPNGNETVLHTFEYSDGAGPSGGMALDSAGSLYGAADGGSAGYGVVYKLDSGGNETILYNFADTDGAYPVGVILDSAGNLYGTTYAGGSVGEGIVFKVSTSGVETVLHNFMAGADGAVPRAGVVLDSTGTLYGTTSGGGEAGGGVVYKITGAVPRR